jgi:hypothetical protein
VLLHQQPEQRQRDERQQQGNDGQGRGVEDRDHEDGQQVVDDRQRQQERPQGGGQVGADDRQYGEGERDVGRRGDGPAGQGAVPLAQIDQHVQQRGHRHATDGGGHGQSSLPGIPEVTGDELPLQLQPGDEEEDREQSVGGPRAQREAQVQGRRADPGVPERGVGIGPGRVGPGQRQDSGHEEKRAADGLLAQHSGDPAGLVEGAAGEQP